MKRRTKAERELAAEVEANVHHAIYQAIKDNAEDWRRDHLGASLIGGKCDRQLWLGFRWAADPGHSGRQLRLFRRGDNEEASMVYDLRLAGMKIEEVNPDTGLQHRVKWGHFGGSCDGIATNVPGLPADERVLLEFKTYSAKSFAYLKSKKVRASKREHFAQMQVYMHGLKLERALYIAVHKDTDEIYVQLVDYDEDAAIECLELARRIIDMPEPPPKMDKDQIPCVYVSKDGTRWPCDYYGLCHEAQMPERNCRTCVSSTPVGESPAGVPAWHCSLNNAYITSAEQRAGCGRQCSIPPIVNADVVDVGERRVTYQFDNGEVVSEGGP